MSRISVDFSKMPEYTRPEVYQDRKWRRDRGYAFGCDSDDCGVCEGWEPLEYGEFWEGTPFGHP